MRALFYDIADSAKRERPKSKKLPVSGPERRRAALGLVGWLDEPGNALETARALGDCDRAACLHAVGGEWVGVADSLDEWLESKGVRQDTYRTIHFTTAQYAQAAADTDAQASLGEAPRSSVSPATGSISISITTVARVYVELARLLRECPVSLSVDAGAPQTGELVAKALGSVTGSSTSADPPATLDVQWLPNFTAICEWSDVCQPAVRQWAQAADALLGAYPVVMALPTVRWTVNWLGLHLLSMLPPAEARRPSHEAWGRIIIASLVSDREQPLLDRIGAAVSLQSDSTLECTAAALDCEFAAVHRGCDPVTALHHLAWRGFTAKTEAAHAFPALQAYVDGTGDVQVPALLSLCIHGQDLSIAHGKRIVLWQDTYIHMLNRHRLWTAKARYRVLQQAIRREPRAEPAEQPRNEAAAPPRPGTAFQKFMNQGGRGKRAIRRDGFPAASAATRRAEPVSPSTAAHVISNYESDGSRALSSTTIKCSNCAKPLDLRRLLDPDNQQQPNPQQLQHILPRLKQCPRCFNSLPICALSLLPLRLINPHLPYAAAKAKLSARRAKSSDRILSEPQLMLASSSATHHNAWGTVLATGDVFPVARSETAMPREEWMMWCASCRHGGLASYMAAWHTTRTVCAVAECMCQCATADHLHLVPPPARTPTCC